jgi:hypothetical protein
MGRHPERGAIAVTTGLLLLGGGLLGFFALSFSVAQIMDSRSELQNGSDSAALAAARSLDGTAAGLTTARSKASNYSLEHLAYDQKITIDKDSGSDLIFGHWHLNAGECKFGTSGKDCFEGPLVDARKITAVKILNGRDGVGGHNAPLDLPFGTWIGAATTKVRSAAVAVGGGPALVKCALPLTIAECKITDSATGALKCGLQAPVVFSNDKNDSVGFINLNYPDDKNAPSGNYSADIINNNQVCNPDYYKIGDAKVQNGNDFSKVNDALRGVDNKGKPVPGGKCWIGETLSWAVIDKGCPDDPDFNNVQPVRGFVKIKITAVADNKGNWSNCAGPVAMDTKVYGSPKNGIALEVLCDAGTEPGEFGGGRDYNSSNVRTLLVQ